MPDVQARAVAASTAAAAAAAASAAAAAAAPAPAAPATRQSARLQKRNAHTASADVEKDEKERAAADVEKEERAAADAALERAERTLHAASAKRKRPRAAAPVDDADREMSVRSPSAAELDELLGRPGSLKFDADVRLVVDDACAGNEAPVRAWAARNLTTITRAVHTLERSGVMFRLGLTEREETTAVGFVRCLVQEFRAEVAASGLNDTARRAGAIVRALRFVDNIPPGSRLNDVVQAVCTEFLATGTPGADGEALLAGGSPHPETLFRARKWVKALDCLHYAVAEYKRAHPGSFAGVPIFERY